LKKILITYFGPFGHFTENPSELIARRLMLEFSEFENISFAGLDVQFDSVERFIEQDFTDVDVIYLLGVASRSEKVKLELTARNFVSAKDNSGAYREGEISINGPQRLYSTLENTHYQEIMEEFHSEVTTSENAGAYLCNYIYYKTLQKLPDKAILFIHIANFSDLSGSVSFERQVEFLSLLVERNLTVN